MSILAFFIWRNFMPDVEQPQTHVREQSHLRRIDILKSILATIQKDPTLKDERTLALFLIRQEEKILKNMCTYPIQEIESLFTARIQELLPCKEHIVYFNSLSRLLRDIQATEDKGYASTDYSTTLHKLHVRLTRVLTPPKTFTKKRGECVRHAEDLLAILKKHTRYSAEFNPKSLLKPTRSDIEKKQNFILASETMENSCREGADLLAIATNIYEKNYAKALVRIDSLDTSLQTLLPNDLVAYLKTEIIK